MRYNNRLILCRYCFGVTSCDYVGNCASCGAPRDKRDIPKPPEDRQGFGWSDGTLGITTFSSSACTGPVVRPDPPQPGEALK